MRLILFVLAVTIGLGANPVRAAESYNFTLNIGPVSYLETYCEDSDPNSPDLCSSNSGAFEGGNVDFAFDLSGPNLAVTCSRDYFCSSDYNLSILDNTFSFRGDKEGGGFGGFSLNFDQNLGGMLPTSGQGFLSGSYSFVHSEGRYGFSSSYEENAVIRAFYTPSVPEPSTWAMMLLGVGFVGGAMRAAKRMKLTASLP